MRGYLEAHGVVADKALSVPAIVSERGSSEVEAIQSTSSGEGRREAHSFSSLFTRSHLSPTKNDVNRGSCANAAMMETIATCNDVETSHRGT